MLIKSVLERVFCQTDVMMLIFSNAWSVCFTDVRLHCKELQFKGQESFNLHLPNGADVFTMLLFIILLL